MSDLGALRDQIIGTAILLFLIFAITDARNCSPAANLAPVVIGGVIGAGLDKALVGRYLGTAEAPPGPPPVGLEPSFPDPVVAAR